MSWLWDSFKSLVVKPDQVKCDAQKKAENEKHIKIVAEEDARHVKSVEDETKRHSDALLDIASNVVCKVDSSKQPPIAPPVAPIVVQEPNVMGVENLPDKERENSPLTGGKKSKKRRQNKKKNTKRKR